MTSLDQYVCTCIYNFPSLYFAPSFHEAKMKVLDQLINVIGNGINDNESLFSEISNTNHSLNFHDIEKYVSGEPLYTGFTGVDDYGKDLILPDPNSRIEGMFTEKEKVTQPEVVYWRKNTGTPFIPYPNFQETYSVIYRCDVFKDLETSFIQGALYYYTHVKQWFSEHGAEYHYAFPKPTEIETEKSTSDMAKYLEKYSSYEEISEAYEVAFKGDVYQFQVDRWAIEKQRTFAFIDKAIEDINLMLETHNG